MSIVKNTTSTRSTHFTIKTLSGLDDVYEIRKYIELTNADFFCNVNPDFDHTVLIMAEIPSGATGYIFGQFNESASVNDFYIKVESNVVTWKYKNNPLVTHAREDGVHIYGYVGGKPVYDYQALSQTAATGRRYANPTIGGAFKIVDLQAQHSCCSSIKIYCARVQGRVTETPSEATAVVWSAYYPASFNGVNTGRILETMYHRATITPDGTSYEASSECVTYGVQLDDLRYLTGSGYRDLLALVCEDGGADTSCGWTSETASAAYHPQAPYASHSFAFNLNGVPIGGTPDAGSGVKGTLIRGRKPKWSIWNDSVKFGFSMLETSHSPLEYKVRFNLFKDIYGNDVPARLEWFNGYNTANNHEPGITNLTNLNVEFHNGVAVMCSNDNTIVGSTTNNGSRDDRRMFLRQDSTDSDIVAKIGNLAPWNYTVEELVAHDNASQYFIYGMAVSMLIGSSSTLEMMSAEVKEDSILCASSSSAVKDKYRNGVQLQSVVSPKFRSYLYKALKNATGNTLPMTAALTLIKNDGSKVMTTDFLPTKENSLTGVIDPKIYNGSQVATVTNWRQIIKLHTSDMCYLNHTMEDRRKYVVTESGNTKTYYLLALLGYNGSAPINAAISFVAIFRMSYVTGSGSSEIVQKPIVGVSASVHPSILRQQHQSLHEAWAINPEYNLRAWYHTSGWTGYDYGNSNHELIGVAPFLIENGDTSIADNATMEMDVYDVNTAPNLCVIDGLWDDERRTVYFSAGGYNFYSLHYTDILTWADTSSYNTKLVGKLLIQQDGAWRQQSINPVKGRTLTLKMDGTVVATFRNLPENEEMTENGYTLNAIGLPAPVAEPMMLSGGGCIVNDLYYHLLVWTNTEVHGHEFKLILS